jgi:hypothetical protein
MNTKFNDVGTLDMLLASGSPGSAAAWLRYTEMLQAEQRSAEQDVVSTVAKKVRQRGKDFNFLP